MPNRTLHVAMKSMQCAARCCHLRRAWWRCSSGRCAGRRWPYRCIVRRCVGLFGDDLVLLPTDGGEHVRVDAVATQLVQR